MHEAPHPYRLGPSLRSDPLLPRLYKYLQITGLLENIAKFGSILICFSQFDLTWTMHTLAWLRSKIPRNSIYYNTDRFAQVLRI